MTRHGSFDWTELMTTDQPAAAGLITPAGG